MDFDALLAFPPLPSLTSRRFLRTLNAACAALDPLQTPPRSRPILAQTTATDTISVNESRPPIHRVASVDIFRGLNVALMIFVNNLAEVSGLPWWTYHRGNVDGMTYVDMVFPGFLFLMGMSIPLALDARLRRGENKFHLWLHVFWRSLSLLALGLFIANALNPLARPLYLSHTGWTLLGLAAIASAWLRFPGEKQHRIFYRTLRTVGLALLAALFLLFRRETPQGNTAGLAFSYWEILGLLGWAYLLVGTLYLLFAKRHKTLLTAFVVLVFLNVASTLDWLRSLQTIPLYWNPFEAGLSSLTLAGVLASLIILQDSYAPTFEQKMRWILAAVVILCVAGFVLRPLGISKNHDTPTWCLYCTAVNLLIALFLLWIADQKRWTAWAKLVTPAGENPLLPYMLAYVLFLFPQLSWLTPIGTQGSWGVLKSALLAAFVLAVSSPLIRRGLLLRV